MSKPKLPPFDADGHCRKCGHDDVRTIYQANAHCTHYPDRCVLEALTEPECCDPKKAEHFHRHCQRCRYWWAEAVIPKPAEVSR